MRKDGKKWEKRFSKLFGGILASGEIERDARILLEEIGARPSGSEAGRAGEAYVEERLKKAGLDEVRLEPFPLLGWERGDIDLEMTRPRKKRVHALSLGLSCGTPDDGLKGPVLDLGFGDPRAFAKCGEALRGKWALVEEGGPKDGAKWHRAVKMSAAQESKALGLLMMSGEWGDIPKTGTCRFGELSAVPGVGISREEGMAIRRMLSAGDEVECRLRMENRSFDAKASNVVGLLRGREHPGETVYVGGHLDSWDVADGALDNGSGILVILAAARALAGLAIRMRRTVAFCFFMGEETGLLGSSHHARLHADRIDSIVSFLNLDIVSEPRRLVSGGGRAAFPLLDDLSRALAPLGVERKVSHRLGLHSDHVPFLLQGVPTLSWQCDFKKGTTRYCHSRADTAEKIDLRGIHLCACATSALLHVLAEEPERPAARIPAKDVEAMLEQGGLKEALIAEGAWPF